MVLDIELFTWREFSGWKEGSRGKGNYLDRACRSPEAHMWSLGILWSTDW